MIQKIGDALSERNLKITKWAHAFKGYASTYTVDILDSFNPELQLKETVSEIENKVRKCCLNQEDLNLWQH